MVTGYIIQWLSPGSVNGVHVLSNPILNYHVQGVFKHEEIWQGYHVEMHNWLIF